MVFDTLYGLDDMGQSRPQMCAGHDVSADGLTWTFTLRDGLTFHDGERVLAKDCAMSVRRRPEENLFWYAAIVGRDKRYRKPSTG